MREKLYEVMEVVDGINVLDSRDVDWSKFTFTSGYYTHRVTSNEIYKPYLISYAYYNTVDYEDIIMLINNVEDPFEMVVGSVLKIPKLIDLKTFILTNSK